LAALLVMALAVNLTKGSATAPATANGPSPASSAGTPLPQPVTGAGGNPGTATLKTVAGVPVGYPDTQTGAVQAAVNYEVARSSVSYFTDPAARHKIIGAMAASGARTQMISNEDAAMKQLMLSLGINSSNANTLVARAAALGTKSDSYSDQVATVEVWMAGVIGTTSKSAPLPVSASWATYTLTLQRESSDWKLVSVTSAAGPTPLDTGSGSPTSVDDFGTANSSFDAPPYVG
jgi:uncharacterized protein YaaQ